MKSTSKSTFHAKARRGEGAKEMISIGVSELWGKHLYFAQQIIRLGQPLLPNRIYILLFSLLGIVYIFGLFVPLMDNDSAHHANIALRMYLTGDYVNLIDYGKDYLDKPHLHFWLAALSYEILGVTTFAYKLPSLLFTILGTYSTYRLGRILYNNEAGKLAALIVASSFAYILANNDVRMDAVLAASIIFSIWQLVAFINYNKSIHVVLAALGLALGFSTKGHIAVFVPAAAILIYIISKKDWNILLNWKWLLMLFLFGVFIFPVVYCYYLQYNLHPEKVVRGSSNINGVKFILLNQSIERFQGESFGSDSKHDYFFFIHSFLWAFAPWSIFAYIAVFRRVKNFHDKQTEWLTTGVFLAMLLIVTFSGFKLPHYLNIIFPTTALLTAYFILNQNKNSTTEKNIFIIQYAVSVVMLLFVAVLTFWSFPVKKLWIIPAVIFFLSIFFYLVKSSTLSRLQKSVAAPTAAIALCFFVLNTNFYPQLLKYQAGNELAFGTKGKVDPSNVHFWKETYSSSYNFYTATLRRQFVDSAFKAGDKTWLMYDIKSEPEILQQYNIGQRFSSLDYEITKLDLRFINPETRDSSCTRMVLGELTGRK